MKVSDFLSKKDQLNELLRRNNGILRTSDATTLGISRTYFMSYVGERNLERISHGIYLAPDAWVDPFYLLQARWPQAIFSHEAALYLWDMAEREPLPMTVTLKSGYNSANLVTAGIKVYTVNDHRYTMGQTTILSPYGHKLNVYNPERTICDLVRSRRHVERQDLFSALKTYVRRPDKNIHLLLRYAKEFRVENVVRSYLEVLL